MKTITITYDGSTGAINYTTKGMSRPEQLGMLRSTLISIEMEMDVQRNTEPLKRTKS